jgi:hypothetical protein
MNVSGRSTLNVGDRTQLTSTASLSDGRKMDVTTQADWVSSGSACSVGDDGALTAVRAGNCSVSAVYEQVGGQLSVTVNGDAGSGDGGGAESGTRLTVSGPSAVQVGTSVQWHAVVTDSAGAQTDVTNSAVWASLSPLVATVNSTGQITGLSPGSAVIQASANGLTGTGTIQVTAGAGNVASLAITGDLSIGVGETTQLQAVATMNDGSTRTVTTTAGWSSASPQVAPVAAGLVTGLQPGSSEITATYGNQSARATVTVSASGTKQLVGIEVDAGSDLSRVAIGDLVRLTVYGVYSDGSQNDVTSAAVLTPDDPLLRVDGPGLVNVLLTGTSALLDPDHVVNVQYGGFTEAVNVKVTPPALSALTIQSSGDVALSANSQLPAVTALLSQGGEATVQGNAPGVTWSAAPAGPLGSALNTLGVTLGNVVSVADGTVKVVNAALFDQLRGLVGGALPVELRATLNGVQSAAVNATIGG